MQSWCWQGSSGQNYEFQVCDRWGAWNDIGGVYIFVVWNPVFGIQLPTPLYVGQCSSFSDRMCSHERWIEAEIFHGAREVHAMHIAAKHARDAIEYDLIQGLTPVMNKQLVGWRAADIYDRGALG
jgi:hypothetical protein